MGELEGLRQETLIKDPGMVADRLLAHVGASEPNGMTARAGRSLGRLGGRLRPPVLRLTLRSVPVGKGRVRCPRAECGAAPIAGSHGAGPPGCFDFSGHFRALAEGAVPAVVEHAVMDMVPK